MRRKPNFLFFITDQQRADWLGCYGHPVLRTPHIDAVAAQGTRFEKFHVASPVCMPNRASLLTGRFPTQHGLRYNGCALSTRANTFVDILAKAGYATAAIGKSHIQPFTNMPPRHGVHMDECRISEAWKEDEGWYEQEQPERYQADDRYSFKLPYYGYSHVEMVTGHGDRCGGHYQQWFRQQASDWRDLRDGEYQLSHNYSCPQAFRTPVPERLYPTFYIRDRTVEYLAGRRTEERPFFLFVSFPDPHHPFNPPGRYWDMYSPDDFEVRVPYRAHKNPTPPMRWLHDAWQRGGEQVTRQTAFMLDEEKLKQAMALTAGMITMIDDAVGDIVAALRGNGLFDDTVICFNADHGDYLGDFNMLLKGALPFQSITRVPFIWSDPENRRPEVSDALASTIDISASILERAGLEPYNGLHGASFLNCLGGSGNLRSELLMEYNDNIARLGFDGAARVRSLISKEHRFTIYRNQDWGELYDLINDPDETNNLWDHAGMRDIRARLSLSMNHHLAALMDESPRAERLA